MKIVITDSGCCHHLARHLKFSGPEAKLIKDILINLNHEDGRHFYICDMGCTHQVKFYRKPADNA